MRRTGVWVSVFRNSIIHEILSEFLQPLRMSEHNGSLRSIVVSSLFGFGFLVGLGHNGSHHSIISSTCELDTGTGWMGIYPTQIFPFSGLTVAWRWSRRAWGRCRMITVLSWRCHWCWRMRTGGRTRRQAWNHDRNEVLRIANYPNPVFNEMWFLTVDPVIRISVFIAKLSEG